jgi:N-acetylmuramic acid 6-phosphate etherase
LREKAFDKRQRFGIYRAMAKAVNKTEQRLPDLAGFDTWDNAKILATLLAGQRRALDAVERALPQISAAADAIATRIAKGGKLIYAGAGTSIRVAVQDGTELPATFGMDEEQLSFLIAGGRDAMFETMADAEDDVAAGKRDGETCTAGDALIAVAASGRTPYTIAVAEAARKNGCLVVSVVNNSGSDLGKAADLEIFLDTGPEVISGSTRMGAGTSQKAALNLLSTLVHTRLGAVHDGLMVNVQAGNSKLIARAAGIVAEIARVPVERAADVLKTTKGDIKAAVLMLNGARDFSEALKLLDDSDSKLRVALAKLKSR